MADQAKIIHQQLSTRYAEAESRHAREMKELTDKLTTAEAEHKLATQILGIRIGELEANIQRVAGEHDAALGRETEVRQKLEKAKEAAKGTKKTLEKRLKGNL